MSKKLPEHQDILGRIIKVGDGVVFSQANGLQIGIVSKINPKMVQLNKIPEGHFRSGIYNKYSRDLVVISEVDLTMYLLKKGT
jgi:hypothetical protein